MTAPSSIADVLEGLAERVEAATEGSRELAATVAKAAGWKPEEGAPGSTTSAPWAWCPDFTSSLDAAMTLVPEGCATMQDWLHYAADPEGSIAYEYDVQRTTDGLSLGHGEARTPALALTAACLRAIAEGSKP